MKSGPFTAQDTDWRKSMLRRLQNRLRTFLIIIFMIIISLILCFSFWNTWQAQQNADIAHIQRMASLIIYQLEADSVKPDDLLSNYESEMDVYSILKDSAGHILFQSNPNTPTDIDTLVKIAEKSIEIQATKNSSNISPVTEQGGYCEITGSNRDRYYLIPASISTKSGAWYSLVLLYKHTAIRELLFRQAPAYCGIWFMALICILFVSRFLLQRAFEPTQRVLQGQKDFIAAASHELKSPLAVIMAKAEDIQSIGSIDSRVKTSLGVIDSECIRMSRLVQDMLLLASSDADKWTINKKIVNVDTFLITLYESYVSVCNQKSIHLELILDNEKYPPLFTDQERLYQILSIFLDNAVYHSPENSIIEIGTLQTAKTLTFYVMDHGSGIADKDKPFIFDRFYCADKSRTDKSHFGLGLSIAYELSKMLSGKVAFNDTSGGGATFTLTLPQK